MNAEGDGDHGKIKARAHPQRPAARARNRRRRAVIPAERKCDPEAHALEREDGDRVSTDRIEADMARADTCPGQADQNVEARRRTTVVNATSASTNGV